MIFSISLHFSLFKVSCFLIFFSTWRTPISDSMNENMRSRRSITDEISSNSCFSNIEIFFYSYFDWKNHKEKIISLYNSKNFDTNCLPSIWFQDKQIKNREDVSSVNAFIKYFITQVYRSFAISKVINFEDNLNDFSINFYDHSAEYYIRDYNFWHNVHVSQQDLEKMKNLTAEEHERLCADLLKNYSIHKWMKLDNEYDVHITVENKN